MTKDKYDICIIGGGPSGYAAAMRAIDFGKKVLLVERDKVGGAGLYNGALSSKSMWEYSMKYHTVRNEMKDYPEETNIEYADVMKAVNGAVFDRKFQLACHIKLLQSITEKKTFTYERGHALLLNKHEVEISKAGKKKTIYAQNIIIATGSRPRKLPTIPIDENIIVTSDGMSSFTDFPKSLVIVGAGVIGCEFATIFSNLGKTKVFLIDKADRILPFEDKEIGRAHV